MSTSRNISFLIGANASNLFKELNKSQKRLNQFGRDVKKIGDTINRNFTAPMALVGLASIKLASDFETSMNKIQNLVGLSAEQVDGMKSSVIALSNETGKSANELSEALFVITSAGARGSEALEILEQSAKGSAIGLGDTQSIARTTTAVLQAYGKENISAEKASDIFFNTVREGNLDAEQLAGSISKVIPLASQMGVGFDEIGANVATLTRLGASADEAGTSLRGLLSSILSPTNQAKEALAGVGLTFDDLRTSIQDQGLANTLVDLMGRFDGNTEALSKVVPNVRALTNVLGVAGSQGEEYVQIANNITESTDTVGDAFDKISDQTSQKFNRSLEKLKNQGIEIGTKLLPVVNDLLDTFMDLVDWFSNLDDSTKELGIQVSVLVGGLGIMLTVLGKVLIVFTAINFKVVAVIAVIAGLIVVGKNMIDNWDYFSAQFTQYWDAIVYAIRKSVESIASLMNRVGLLSDENLSKLEEKTNEAKESLIESTIKAGEASKGIVSLTDSFFDLTGWVREATGQLLRFNREAEKTGGKSDSPDDDTPEEIERLENPLSHKEVTGATLTGFTIPTVEAGTALEDLKKRLRETHEGAVDMSSALQSTVSQGIVAFSETLADVFTGDAGAKGFFNSLILLVTDFGEQLGKMIVGIGVASLSLRSVFSNPMGAILAGGALITMSRMAKGLMQKGIDDSGVQPAQMATGGIIPKGFPNDTFPAMLSSGETVLPATKPLPDVMNSGSGRQIIENRIILDGREIFRNQKNVDYQLNR